MIAAGTTIVVLIVALAGTRFAAAGISPWPRFWGIAFFALLLWPVVLTVVGRIAGGRVALACAAVIVIFSAAQQAGSKALPLPAMVRWSVTLAGPGDAIRRQLNAPPAGDSSWERAWSLASRAAVAICTEEAIDSTAGVVVGVRGGPSSELTSLARSGRPGSIGWYELPVTRDQLVQRPIVVDVQREGASGPPARVCGGRDDPTRPGWGPDGSFRLRSGQWVTGPLADAPLPLAGGLPAPSRYYIELRLYDASGRPRVGIWY